MDHRAPPPPPARVIEVAAGLIFRNGALLIAQRQPGVHLAGLWEFPGGKREPGETYETCLRRELREELGVEVELAQLLLDVTHHYPEKTVRLQFFRCQLHAGEPQPIGCAALAWISPADLDRYAFPAADEKLLELLRTQPELWKE